MNGQVTVEQEDGRITVFDRGVKVAQVKVDATQGVDLADYLRKRL